MLLMYNLMYVFVLLLIVKPYIIKKDKFNSVITANIVTVFNLKD